MDKVQVSYFVQLPQSKFPDLSSTLGPFPDFNRIP